MIMKKAILGSLFTVGLIFTAGCGQGMTEEQVENRIEMEVDAATVELTESYEAQIDSIILAHQEQIKSLQAPKQSVAPKTGSTKPKTQPKPKPKNDPSARGGTRDAQEKIPPKNPSKRGGTRSGTNN